MNATYFLEYIKHEQRDVLVGICFDVYLFLFGELPTLLRRELIDFLQGPSKVTYFIYFCK